MNVNHMQMTLAVYFSRVLYNIILYYYAYFYGSLMVATVCSFNQCLIKDVSEYVLDFSACIIMHVGHSSVCKSGIREREQAYTGVCVGDLKFTVQ